jgi:hypothetical protein
VKILSHLLCLILVPGCIFSQSFSFPKFNGPIKYPKELFSAKWTLKDSAMGDLNGDHLADMAVILEYDDTVTELRWHDIENTGKPRILMILFWDSVGKAYDVAVQNNTFILRDGEGGMAGDPYAGIHIQRGVFEINYEFVRESLSYKFRFRSPEVYLIGASDGGVSGGKFDSWDFNFSTGRAKHEWHDQENEKDPEHIEWKKIGPMSPIRLRDMKFTYQFEIFPNVFI